MKAASNQDRRSLRDNLRRPFGPNHRASNFPGNRSDVEEADLLCDATIVDEAAPARLCLEDSNVRRSHSYVAVGRHQVTISMPWLWIMFCAFPHRRRLCIEPPVPE